MPYNLSKHALTAKPVPRRPDTICCVVISSSHNLTHLHLGGQRIFYAKCGLNILDRLLTITRPKLPPILPQGCSQWYAFHVNGVNFWKS